LSITAGIDVGGTKILGIVVDRSAPARVLAEHRVETPSSAEAVLDALAGVVKTLALEAPVASVGVGIAGLVDREGMLHTSPNLPMLSRVAVRAELERRTGLPVAVENDATATAWGEHRSGAGRGASDMLCLTFGTGIGAGVVLGGELVRGAHGFAGEAGHMVVDPSGPPCPCGRRGCWERLGSGSGLRRLAREAAEAGRLRRALELAGGDLGVVQGEHVNQAAQEGDREALDLLRSFGWWIALGISNLVTLLDTSVVVMGGGVVGIGEPLLGPVRDHYHHLVMADTTRPEMRIVPAELGDRAGATGAALLAPVT
jgi:glucokinase